MVCDIILNVQAIRLTYLFAEIELKKVFNLFQVATRFLASRYQKYFPLFLWHLWRNGFKSCLALGLVDRAYYSFLELVGSNLVDWYWLQCNFENKTKDCRMFKRIIVKYLRNARSISLCQTSSSSPVIYWWISVFWLQCNFENKNKDCRLFKWIIFTKDPVNKFMSNFFQFSCDLLVDIRIDNPEKQEAGAARRPPEARNSERNWQNWERIESGKRKKPIVYICSWGFIS